MNNAIHYRNECETSIQAHTVNFKSVASVLTH